MILTLLFFIFGISSNIQASIPDTLNQNYSFKNKIRIIKKNDRAAYTPENKERQYYDGSYLDTTYMQFDLLYNNTIYHYNEFDKLIDTLYGQFLMKGVPKYSFSNENFSVWYNTDELFKTIIDNIDSLPVYLSSYYSTEAQVISNQISNLKYKNQKIYCLLYFGKHFFYMFDYSNAKNDPTPDFFKSRVIYYYTSDLIFKDYIDEAYDLAYKDSLQQVSVILHKYMGIALDTNELKNEDIETIVDVSNGETSYGSVLGQIKSLELIGDFLKSQENLTLALSTYFQALDIATKNSLFNEAGRIEYKIGLNYLGRSNNLYDEKSLPHFQNSAYYYSLVNNIMKQNYSKIRESQITFYLINQSHLNLMEDEVDTLKGYFDDGFKHFCNNIYMQREDYYLFKGLANYYETRNAFLSIYFNKLCIIAAFDNNSIKDIVNFSNGFQWLAYDYEKINDEKETIHNINRAVEISRMFKLNWLNSFYLFEKGNLYRRLGKFNEGLLSVREGFKNKEVSDFYLNRGNYIAYLLYSGLFEKEGLQKYNDSADIFAGRYFRNINFHTNEINELNEIKHNNLADQYYKNIDFYEREIEYQKYIFDSLRYEYSIQLKKFDTLRTKVFNDSIFYNKLKQTIKNTQDTLIKANIILGSTNELLEDAKGKLTIARRARNVAWFVFVFLLIVTILNFTIYRKKLKKSAKKQERLESQSRAMEESIRDKNAHIHNQDKEIREQKDQLISIEAEAVSILKEKDIELANMNKSAIKSNAKAALSQLYARTDSHDLGHVLDAYKSIDDFSFNETDGQYKFIPNSNLQQENLNIGQQGKELLEKFTFKNSNNNERSIYPNLMGYFNRFLKTRMDFRADVATTDPNSLTTLDFYQDIFVPFNNNLIFNNRISGIEDSTLWYKFKIFKDKEELNDEYDLPIAVPNDVLGCQAMYIIWSNVIRNTVKHGELTEKENELTLKIMIQDYIQNHDFYEVRFFSEVYRPKSIIGNLVEKRNLSFDDSIWHEEDESRLRDNSLGTIEMATCAAYLRKLPVTEVVNPKYNLFNNDVYQNGDPYFDKEKKVNIPMIMYAYEQPKDDVGNKDDLFALGYKFYLSKPKEVLVVCDQADLLSNNVLIKNNDRKALLKYGIEFIEPDDTQTDTFNHKFLVYMGSENDFRKFQDASISLTASLPKRQIYFEVEQSFDNRMKFIDACWCSWAKQYKKSVNLLSCDAHDENLVFPEQKIDNAYINVKLYNHHDGLTMKTDEEIINKLEDGSYHEMICGHHWTKNHLRPDLEPGLFNESKYAEPYLETIFTNVIIIDERIQKSIVIHKKKYADKIPFATYFKQMGIFIPLRNDIDPDLNKKNLMEEKGKIVEFIKRYIDRSSFVVIHLGILEKLLIDKNEKSDTAIDLILNEIISGEANSKKVVITSGRGKANNVSQDVSYVPISLVQNAIETTFDKFRLVQILYDSRKSL
ncbi:MAG: hypothetical protein Q8J88_11385 [Bacteroidales bacterium]|nr:hypothetical protein [Bacteroidales bacterium]